MKTNPFKNVFWLDRDLAEFGSLSNNIDCDVAIIGGGITGITAAKTLSDQGYSVCLLEKRLIGTGASGRNAGFVITGPVEHYARAVNLIGREKSKRLWNDSILGLNLIKENIKNFNLDVSLSESGSLLLADSENEDKETLETIQEMNSDGFPGRYLNKKKVAELLNTESFYGAGLIEDNFAYNPYDYVSGLAKNIALSDKVQLADNTEVTAIHFKCEFLEIVTENAKVTSQMLLVASNAYAQLLGPYFEDKIIPVRGQVIATTPILAKIWEPIIYANFGFEYFRQLPGGELIMGGWRENMPGGDAFHYKESIDEKAVTGLVDYIKDKFPNIPEFEVTHSWAGTMGFSKDGIPLLGPLPGKNRVFVAAGFTGHGMAFGSIIGHYAGMAISGNLEKDISMYYPSRFNK